jgi:hypothetical protein
MGLDSRWGQESIPSKSTPDDTIPSSRDHPVLNAALAAKPKAADTESFWHFGPQANPGTPITEQLRAPRLKPRRMGGCDSVQAQGWAHLQAPPSSVKGTLRSHPWMIPGVGSRNSSARQDSGSGWTPSQQLSALVRGFHPKPWTVPMPGSRSSSRQSSHRDLSSRQSSGRTGIGIMLARHP